MDYGLLGLRCGLEIHQQVNTTKLFCSCPANIQDDPPHFMVKRFLRAVPGERGEVDIAAAHESLKEKQFLYGGYKDTTCLVELDEEPPHPLNPDALHAALDVALLLKMNVVDVAQVMRKTVIDGSNTSGFQRTALLAYDGQIDTTEGTVSITSLCVEEDSARIITDDGKTAVYRLDRLGVPLIEIATGPDIHTPQQCLDVAEKLGMFLRSTGKVKRGLGTIRQDVNVSIRGGARVEIKGAQELRLLPLLVENEVLRQKNLLALKKQIHERPLQVIVDCSAVFSRVGSTIIKKVLGEHGVILALLLSGFNGLMGMELQPNRRLGSEFSDRAKVRAGVGGIFHSDELPAYGITVDEVNAVRKTLDCSAQDGFVLVAASKEKGMKALNAVFERAREACDGVPSEVRKANPDGTTSYLRPMPGAARMYPETDTPLVRPDVRGIVLPELLDHKIRRFEKLGLSPDLAETIVMSEHVFLFEELVRQYPTIKAAYVAEVLTAKMTELRRDYQVGGISDSMLRHVFDLLSTGKIHKDIMLDVLIDAAKGQLKSEYYESLGTEELHREIETIIAQNKGAPMGALMGIAVKRLKGKASGQKIAEMLKEFIGE